MDRFLEHSANILPRLTEAFGISLSVTVVSAFFGLLLGLLVALIRISRNRALTSAAGFYVTIFRGTPLLLQIVVVYYGLPELGITLPAFASGVLALSLNSGAYMAEIIRAAIQSVDKGQMEAARSLGMSYLLAMRRIILPQTFRRLLPPTVNELAALTKDSSLVSVITITELMKASQHFVSRTALVFQTYFWTALFYLVVTVALTKLADHYERKLEARE